MLLNIIWITYVHFYPFIIFDCNRGPDMRILFNFKPFFKFFHSNVKGGRLRSRLRTYMLRLLKPRSFPSSQSWATLLYSGIEIVTFVSTTLNTTRMLMMLLRRFNFWQSTVLMLLITVSSLILSNNLEIGICLPN